MLVVCSPAAITSQYKSLLAGSHSSIDYNIISPLRYLNEKNAMFNRFLPTIIWVAHLSQIYRSQEK